MLSGGQHRRLVLRADNADRRLTALGRKLGLVDDHRWDMFREKQVIEEQAQYRFWAQ